MTMIPLLYDPAKGSFQKKSGGLNMSFFQKPLTSLPPLTFGIFKALFFQWVLLQVFNTENIIIL